MQQVQVGAQMYKLLDDIPSSARLGNLSTRFRDSQHDSEQLLLALPKGVIVTRDRAGRFYGKEEVKQQRSETHRSGEEHDPTADILSMLQTWVNGRPREAYPATSLQRRPRRR